MPANVWVLFLAQAFAMCATPLMVFSGGLASREMAPTPVLATLPVALLVVGTALSVYPASQLSYRFGRKRVFLGAMVFGFIASVFAMLSLRDLSFIGFTVASAMIGMVMAVVQQFRFAAMESVEAEKMPVAASRLLTAGLISAWLGPELVVFGQWVMEGTFAGAFSLLAGLYIVSLVILGVGYRDNPPVKSSAAIERNDVDSGHSLLKNPGFWVAAGSAAIGYGVMSFIMTATPMSMNQMQGFSLIDTKWVIQSHILAMFLPSLISGQLIQKLGHSRMIVMGLCAYALTVALGIWNVSYMHYWWALVLLGVGWNFLFVAGTSLLPKMHAPEDSHKAQGLNDAMVFSFQALAALSSGAILFSLGWNGVLLLTLPLLVGMLFLLWRWQDANAGNAEANGSNQSY